jgi:hypothetical protein
MAVRGVTVRVRGISWIFVTWTALSPAALLCRSVHHQHANSVTHCVTLQLWLEENGVPLLRAFLIDSILRAPFPSFI